MFIRSLNSAPLARKRASTAATILNWLASTIIAAAAAATSAGCSTAAERLEQKLKPNEPVSRVYPAKYEEVEAAIKQAMIRYPQRVDNTDAGIFETDYVKGESRFRPPHKEVELSSGYRYRILIRLVRGRSTDKPAVRVLVTKKIELARDFFSSPEEQGSDGMEEAVILYRIAREINISRAIARSVEKANRQN